VVNTGGDAEKPSGKEKSGEKSQWTSVTRKKREQVREYKKSRVIELTHL